MDYIEAVQINKSIADTDYEILLQQESKDVFGKDNSIFALFQAKVYNGRPGGIVISYGPLSHIRQVLVDRGVL